MSENEAGRGRCRLLVAGGRGRGLIALEAYAALGGDEELMVRDRQTGQLATFHTRWDTP